MPGNKTSKAEKPLPKKEQKRVRKEVGLDFDNITAEELQKAVDKAGGQRAFARKFGMPRSTVQDRLKSLKQNAFGHRPAPEAVHVGQGSGVRRFLLSSAQDNTRVHEKFLKNLEAYCDYLDVGGSCEIMIGGFTYSKKLFTDHDAGSSWFHELVRPYLVVDKMRLADKVDFCAEMNTLPTAVDPLSGLETYTRHRCGIFPHAKIALRSVATMKHDPAKMIMTTGACTLPNYLPMKAGTKASFHHVIGAVLVEIDAAGDFFTRHLIADEDGSFYDLDRRIEKGRVTTGHRITALTPGDIHTFQIDPTCSKSLFGVWPTDKKTSDGKRYWTEENPRGPMNMLDVLKPEHLFLHDVLDFKARNHHSSKDPHERFKIFVEGRESVRDELEEVAFFMSALKRNRSWLDVSVVESNHDQALLRWLKEADYRYDPVNAAFFLKAQLAAYNAIQNRVKDFSLFEHLVQTEFGGCQDITFLREDQSCVIGGVEHSIHGHRGPNGSRGSAQAFVKVAAKISKGHGHSAVIIDGVYEAGTTSLMNLGYNAGASSWSHTAIVQYANGKRTLVTVVDGKWRA